MCILAQTDLSLLSDTLSSQTISIVKTHNFFSRDIEINTLFETNSISSSQFAKRFLAFFLCQKINRP